MRIRQFMVALAFAATESGAIAAPIGASPPATARAVLQIPLTFTKVDDLEFGTVIPATGSGTVRIDAVTGLRTFSGGVTGVASDGGRRALMAGGGSGGQRVVIDLTSPAQLTSLAGDTIDVLALSLDGSVVRTIDPTTRSFSVGVGGVLLIGANQAEGVYSSTFDITAEYL